MWTRSINPTGRRDGTNVQTSPGDVADEVPPFNEVGLFALQPDDALIRAFLKVLVLVEALLGLLVEEGAFRSARGFDPNGCRSRRRHKLQRGS